MAYNVLSKFLEVGEALNVVNKLKLHTKCLLILLLTNAYYMLLLTNCTQAECSSLKTAQTAHKLKLKMSYNVFSKLNAVHTN